MANTTYSNMSIISAVNDKTGTSYKAIFLRGYVSKPEARTTSSGQFVLNVTCPINNRAKGINTALGTSFPTQTDNVIWAKVAFWGKTGERLQKYMKDRKSVLIDMIGQVSTRDYTTRNGNKGTSVEISAFDFWGIPFGGDSQNNTKKAPQSQQKPAQSSSFDDFEEDEDGDLPF